MMMVVVYEAHLDEEETEDPNAEEMTGCGCWVGVFSSHSSSSSSSSHLNNIRDPIPTQLLDGLTDARRLGFDERDVG